MTTWNFRHVGWALDALDPTKMSEEASEALLTLRGIIETRRLGADIDTTTVSTALIRSRQARKAWRVIVDDCRTYAGGYDR